MAADITTIPTAKLDVMLRLAKSWPITAHTDKERHEALVRQRPLVVAIEKELARRQEVA